MQGIKKNKKQEINKQKKNLKHSKYLENNEFYHIGNNLKK